MKIKLLGAAAALAVFSMSGVANAAEDTVPYSTLTNCAAFVMLEAQVYGTDDSTTEEKAKSESFYRQAAALTVAASLLHDKNSDTVLADVKAQNSKMIDQLGNDGYAKKLIEDNAETCNAMGEAAAEALAEKK